MSSNIKEIISEEFGIGKLSAPWGSCDEKFLNEKIIEISNKHNFSPKIKELFKENPYVFAQHQYFDNGVGAGKHFISLLEEYMQEVQGERAL